MPRRASWRSTRDPERGSVRARRARKVRSRVGRLACRVLHRRREVAPAPERRKEARRGRLGGRRRDDARRAHIKRRRGPRVNR